MEKTRHYFLNELQDKQMSGVIYKNHQLKKKIISLLDKKGSATINEISKKFNSSSPKINTLIQELIDDGLIEDLGKAETEVGRRPHLYGLISDSMYFLGVDVEYNSINIGLVDFNESLIVLEKNIPFNLDNSEESLNDLCAIINNFVKQDFRWREKIVSLGVNLSGRINHITGYSHNFFNSLEQPLSEVIKSRTNFTTFIENDTRAKAFYEFRNKKTKNDILYVYVDYGLGLSVLAHGRLQYGKSGYSGGFGHIPFFENEIICRCGKKGCLETEVSGRALVNQFEEKLSLGFTSSIQKKSKNNKDINMTDIIDAANEGDTLSIELIGVLAGKLGKGITSLIHLYNPELVIFGGALTEAGDYFLLPLLASVNKYSLSIVREDSQFQLAKITEGTGVLGACLLIKDRILK